MISQVRARPVVVHLPPQLSTSQRAEPPGLGFAGFVQKFMMRKKAEPGEEAPWAAAAAPCCPICPLSPSLPLLLVVAAVTLVQPIFALSFASSCRCSSNQLQLRQLFFSSASPDPDPDPPAPAPPLPCTPPHPLCSPLSPSLTLMCWRYHRALHSRNGRKVQGGHLRSLIDVFYINLFFQKTTRSFSAQVARGRLL